MKLRSTQRLLIAVVTALVVVGGTFVVMARAGSGCNLSDGCAEDGSTALASYPITGSRSLMVTDDVRLVLALGSPVSIITRRDVALLKQAGVAVDSALTLTVGESADGRKFMSTRRYVIDLPAGEDPDGRPYPAIKAAGFLLAPDGEESTLAMDILQNFVVELHKEPRLLVLHRAVPEGFDRLSDLEAPTTLASLLGQGRRYFLELTVEDHANPYLIDTFFDNGHLRMPLSDTIMAAEQLTRRRIIGVEKTFEMQYTDKVWVRCGWRAGTHPAFFGEGAHGTDYSVNPLQFYPRDCIFNYPGRELLLKQKVSD